MTHHTKALCALLSALLAFTVPAATAQVLEEIVVTAQKREQNIQDVGIAITALSGTQLQELNLDNMQEISQQIPGLQLQTFTPSFTIFNLRGISQNNFTDNLEAPIAVYVDDVYVSSMNAVGMQMYDMERVEVLRGPQGTLFGRNATGGLIHYVTNKADETETNGYVQGLVSDFGTLGIEGAVGGSFSDAVRGRIAARWEQSDGYVEAGVEPFTGSQVTGRDTYGADGYAIRGSLQIDASDKVLIDLGASYTKDDDVPTGMYIVTFADFDPDTGLGVPLAGGTGPLDGGASLAGDPHKHASNENPFFDRETLNLRANVSADFDNGMQFTSITGFLDLDKFYQEDACGGLCFFPFTTTADVQQFTQEFRLSGETDATRWQAGAYYMDIDMVTANQVEGATITGSPQGIVRSDLDITSENWSVFGQVEFDLTDALTLIAGLRWSQDDKELDFFQTSFNMEDQGIPSGTVIFDLADEAVGAFADVPIIDYGDYAGRLQLNMRTGEDTLWFLSWNRGIKGGNWTAAAAVTIDELRHKEEVLNSFEIGVKSTLANGTARLNATAFYYDYKDYQAFSLTGLTPQVTNSDATASGGEIELFWTPGDGWDLILGAAFLSSEVDFVPAVFPGTGTSNAEFPQAPGTSINGLVRKSWEAGGGNFAVQLDGNWNGDQWMEGTNSLVSKQDSYGVLNGNVTYGTDQWSISAWLKNLTDEDYLLYNLDLGLAGFIEQVYAPPRTWGVTLRFNWD
ncbi:MAG: TonB-dependent receptor [Gammaproteobacteria bacterium]|nr:TonB-dependent receptor [Gammaproteobacteria bacterium]